MTQNELEEMLIAIVNEIQELSGREKTALSPASNPITDLPGFDSLNGVEATVEIITRININIKSDNVFVEDGKPLTIAQVAKNLMACLQEET